MIERTREEAVQMVQVDLLCNKCNEAMHFNGSMVQGADGLLYKHSCSTSGCEDRTSTTQYPRIEPRKIH